MQPIFSFADSSPSLCTVKKISIGENTRQRYSEDRANEGSNVGQADKLLFQIVGRTGQDEICSQSA